MFQVRIHGRGGQGVVTAADLLSMAAFSGGAHAQAFPSFGSERTGAPVVSFCRIDDKPIRVREPVMEPDCVIVQDPTLLRQIDVFAGLTPEGYVLINSERKFAELGLAELDSRRAIGRARAVPAGEHARATVGRPLPNAALLGAFAALTNVVSFEAVAGAIRHNFNKKIGEANVAAAQLSYDYVLGNPTASVTAVPAGAAQ